MNFIKARHIRTITWQTCLSGSVIKIVKYFLLISFGFVYLYPIIFMIGYSLMDETALRNQMVNYIPTRLEFQNFRSAILAMDYWRSLSTSIIVSLLPTIASAIISCVTAYGLARFRFPGRKIILALIIATFIIPPVVTMLPQFLRLQELGLIGTPFAFLLPASLGQGIRSSILILVFYQVLSSIPLSLDEAARIDGAGALKLFIRIAIPLAASGFVIAFLFSFIWYWNETTQTSLYMGVLVTTLPMQLTRFASAYGQLFGQVGMEARNLDQAIYMAGTLLNIIPLLIFYFFTQKQFVQSVERSGITGE